MTKLNELYGYYDTPKKVRDTIVNGCGPSGWGWKARIIPETLYGLDVSEACNIHDFGYYFGVTLWDKESVDDMFLENMNTLISKGSWWFRFLRRRRALKYYWAVRIFGKRAFMANKEGINQHFVILDYELKKAYNDKVI